MRTTISILTLATVLLLAVAATAHDKVVVIPLIKHYYGPTSCSTHNDCSSGKCTTEGTCAPQSKFVFVSSATYNGNLGALSGADSKCQDLAVAAGLPGTYKAWLSDGTRSPSNRFTIHNEPYVLIDGSVVADDWDDLTDGSLDHEIFLNEKGERIYRLVWTNTLLNGESIERERIRNCYRWTVSSDQATGDYGHDQSYDHRFTSGSTGGCNNHHSLYCFEQ